MAWPELEIWGPYDDKAYIQSVILEAGRDVGVDLRQVGSRAYSTNTLELPKVWFQYALSVFCLIAALGMTLRTVELTISRRDIRAEGAAE